MKRTGLFVVASMLSVASYANPLKLCVFDFVGAQGDIMNIARDFSLESKNWGQTVDLQVYTNSQKVIQDFDKKLCDGVIADNFHTKKYNNFVGSIGAVSLIPNHKVAARLLGLMGSDRLSRNMQTKYYEVTGVIPFGIVHFMTRSKSVKSIADLEGVRMGVLSEDPSQARLASRIGSKPVIMTYENAVAKFEKNEIDIIPAPPITFLPYEVPRHLGNEGGVVKYPVLFMSMNVVFHRDKIEPGYGLKSRKWFSQKTPEFFRLVERWHRTIDKKYWVDIPKSDIDGYDRLISQLRKEFIANGVYDAKMINLAQQLRCVDQPQYFECRGGKD